MIRKSNVILVSFQDIMNMRWFCKRSTYYNTMLNCCHKLRTPVNTLGARKVTTATKWKIGDSSIKQHEITTKRELD